MNAALLEQLDHLSAAELSELRSAIQTKLDDEVPVAQWAILEQRIAEADANPDDYITLEEWKARRTA